MIHSPPVAGGGSRRCSSVAGSPPCERSRRRRGRRLEEHRRERPAGGRRRSRKGGRAALGIAQEAGVPPKQKEAAGAGKWRRRVGMSKGISSGSGKLGLTQHNRLASKFVPNGLGRNGKYVSEFQFFFAGLISDTPQIRV